MGLVSNVISKIKGNKDLKKGIITSFESLFTPVFSSTYDASLNDVYVSCANAHARHASKFMPNVYRNETKSEDPSKQYLNKLLSLRPNPLMSAAQFWERVANLYYLESNVFIFLEWNYINYKEPLKALWILDLEEHMLELKSDKNGNVYLSFTLNGEPHYTSMENIIHIARNTGPNILGEKNLAIKKVLDIISTNYEGMEQAIKTSAFIRFIVQSTTLLNEDVRKSRAKAFAEAYLGKDSSGVVYLDSAQQIVPVVPNNKYANEAEMKLFENKIYNYMGISEEILKAKFKEDDWNAYYDSSIEPFAYKISQELTYKIFTEKEISFGNRIAIVFDKLDTASLKTKIAVAQVVQKLPTYRPNDVNRLLGMPVTENGEKEFSTLNYVDANKQNQYQNVNGPEEKPITVQEDDSEEETKND
jgi:HK97 family phage portal protein